MSDALDRALERALGVPVDARRAVSGGDVCEAWQVDTARGRFFVKTHRRAPAGLFACEARGLEWLREADAVGAPDVLACADVGEAEVPFLALAWIEQGARPSDYDERLGRALATLHARGASGFGFERDGFIGPLAQSNATRSSWAAFYRDCRIAPLVRQARDAQLLDASLGAGFDRLLAGLEQRVGPPEPPARLHGDLWAGNVLCDARGAVWLVDPAVYGGHREVDLAMLRLFGGAGERAFDAYDECFPLAPGHAERVPLCQLYPLLVHLLLFGAGYRAPLEAALRRCL